MEFDVKDKIRAILDSKKDGVDIAIDLCLYCMKTQIFDEGNKRASVILANYYLIAHGLGVIAVKDGDAPEFKKDLVVYYEEWDEEPVRTLFRNKALRTFQQRSNGFLHPFPICNRRGRGNIINPVSRLGHMFVS